MTSANIGPYSVVGVGEPINIANLLADINVTIAAVCASGTGTALYAVNFSDDGLAWKEYKKLNVDVTTTSQSIIFKVAKKFNFVRLDLLSVTGVGTAVSAVVSDTISVYDQVGTQGRKPAIFPMRAAYGQSQSSSTPQTQTGMFGQSCMVPYYAVRISYRMLGGNGPATGFKAIIAATDDTGTRDFTDPNAAMFKPIVTPKRAGTTYNTIVTDGSPGWKQVTWNGASSIDLPDAGAGNFSQATSDIIYESGVFDSKSGTYPLLMRYFYGSAGIGYVSNRTGLQTGTNYRDDLKKNVSLNIRRGATDAVTTPGNWTDANTAATESSAPDVIVEYFTAGGVMSVSVVGDSRFSVSSTFASTRDYRGLDMYINNELVNRNIPCAVSRHGFSGATSTQYNTYALPDYNLQSAAGWLVYLVFTVNDGVPSSALVTAAQNRALTLINAARAKGQKVLLVPIMPNSIAYTATEQANIAAMNRFCLQNADVVFDALDAYANPNGTWRRMNFDNSHMNDAGYQDMAKQIVTKMLAYDQAQVPLLTNSQTRQPKLTAIGDSLTAMMNQLSVITNAVRSSNVTTVTVTGHGLYAGARCRLDGLDTFDPTLRGIYRVVSRVDANNFTIANYGPSGTLTLGSTPRCHNLQRNCNDSPINWMNILSNQTFEIAELFAASGRRVHDMLKDVPNALATGAGYCLVLGGTNDIYSDSQTAAVVLSGLRAIHNGIVAGGQKVLVCTIPPAIGASYNAAKAKVTSQVNAGLRADCRKDGNKILLDFYAAIVDPVNASQGIARANTIKTDDVHWTQLGAYLAGKKGASVLAANGIAWQDERVQSNADTYGFDTSSANILDAGWGTGGSVSAPVTGTMTSGYVGERVASCAGVGSTPAAADGVGYTARMVATPTANGDGTNIRTSGSTWDVRTVTNVEYTHQCNMAITGIAGSSIIYHYPYISGTVDGTSIPYVTSGLHPSDTTPLTEDWSGVIKQPPFLYTGTFVGTLYHALYFGASGTAVTMDVTRGSIRGPVA